MKFLLIASLLLVVGCASGTPIDFLIPTKKAPLSEDYLGHLDFDGPKWWYHNLATTKFENKLMDLRAIELQGEYKMITGYNKIMVDATEPISNMAWGLVLTGLAGAGIMVPRPQERRKINEAGATDSREFKPI